MRARLPSIQSLPVWRAGSSRFPAGRFSDGVRLLCAALAAACLLCAPCGAAKQKGPTKSTVTGVVKDQDDNKIGGATVTLKDLQTSRTVAIYTDATGEYRFTDLDPQHDYQIQASFRGVSSEPRQLLSFGIRRDLVMDLIILSGESKDQIVAERLAALLNWQPGSVVADVRAGEGGLASGAAKFVGPSGRIFATVMDPKQLDNLEDHAAREKDQNITVIKAGEAQTNLPPACCDSIFMRYAYHHFSQPAQEDASLFQALKSGGFLAVIDFLPTQDASAFESPPEEAPSNRGGHGITQQALTEELTAAGFQLVTAPTDWPGKDYCLVFRKPLQ